MIITLDAFELRECERFAKLSAFTQQGIEFGQHDTADRGIAETARDTMIGKVAEVAVAKLLKRKGLHCPVDFDIYERGEWDDSDIKIFKWDIDIKSTVNGRWLMIERKKLLMRQNQQFNLLPDALISCNTEWSGSKPTGNVKVNGIISLQTFIDRSTKIRKGEFIPGTGTRMQADNYGIRSDSLSNNWDSILEMLYRKQPIPKDKIVLKWGLGSEID